MRGIITSSVIIQDIVKTGEGGVRLKKSILLIILELFIFIGTSSCVTAVSKKSVQKNRLLVSKAWGNIFRTIDYQNGHNVAFVRIYDVNFEEKEYDITLSHLIKKPILFILLVVKINI